MVDPHPSSPALWNQKTRPGTVTTPTLVNLVVINNSEVALKWGLPNRRERCPLVRCCWSVEDQVLSSPINIRHMLMAEPGPFLSIPGWKA
jgi:hypothetical protein